MAKLQEEVEVPQEKPEKPQKKAEKSPEGWRMPDVFTVLRWGFINLPYAFAGLLVGIYYYYIRDYGQGISTIFAAVTFVLLFVVPFYIGEKAKTVPSPLKVPMRLLHYVAVSGVQMALVFLVVLTVLVKDHLSPDVLPATPVSERLGGTPGLPEEEWAVPPEFGQLVPDEVVPDDAEALDPEPAEIEDDPDDALTDDVLTDDAVRSFFLNVLDRAELSLAVVKSGELDRFPFQTFFSALMALAVGFLSWLAFKKRPWRIKFQEVKYEEEDPFRTPM